MAYRSSISERLEQQIEGIADDTHAIAIAPAPSLPNHLRKVTLPASHQRAASVLQLRLRHSDKGSRPRQGLSEAILGDSWSASNQSPSAPASFAGSAERSNSKTDRHHEPPRSTSPAGTDSSTDSVTATANRRSFAARLVCPQHTILIHTIRRICSTNTRDTSSLIARKRARADTVLLSLRRPSSR